jgi:hypothetical protein
LRSRQGEDRDVWCSNALTSGTIEDRSGLGLTGLYFVLISVVVAASLALSLGRDADEL